MKINDQKLNIAMANKCFDQKALAIKTGVSYATIRRSTQNNKTRPSTIGKIAKALGVAVEDLIEKEV